jgi:hypothetical protein
MTRHFDLPRPHLNLPALRSRLHDAVVTRGSMEIGAAGAIALGAFAIGAIAIGALAINRLAVRWARIERLSVGRLEVDRLIIHDQEESETGRASDEPEEEEPGLTVAAL